MTIHPALRPWLWCCVWLAVIWIPLVMRANEFWLQSHGIPAEATGTPRIIAIGDSLLGRSLPPAEEFNALLPDGIYWLHVALDARDFRYFVALVSGLTRLEPDIILVEDQLLLNKWAELQSSLLDKEKRYTSAVVSDLFNLPEETLPELIPFPKEVRLKYLQWAYQSNLRFSTQALVFLQKLQEISDRVIVFSLPRAESLSPGAVEDRWLVMARQKLEPMGIPIIRLGETLPEDFYSDGSHVNDSGRAVRVAQFQKLVEEITGAQQP